MTDNEVSGMPLQQKNAIHQVTSIGRQILPIPFADPRAGGASLSYRKVRFGSRQGTGVLERLGEWTLKSKAVVTLAFSEDFSKDL